MHSNSDLTTPPLISVVMGVYNGADVLEAGVRCILEQTWQDFELIVVDDGSRDESPAILARLAMSDPRVRVVRQDNAGLTRALIAGCALARGRYIARQDADDWSHPERLEIQLRLLEADPQIGFVSCATAFVGPRGEQLSTIHHHSDTATATDQLLNHRKGPGAHGSVLMRRSAYEQVGGYRAQFYFAQDSDLWLRLAEQVQFASATQVLYHARRDLGGISSTRRAEQSAFAGLLHAARAARVAGQSEQGLLDEAAALCERIRAGTGSAAGTAASNSVAMAYLIGSQLVMQEDPRGRWYLRSVLKHRPWHWKAWVRLLQSLSQSLRSAIRTGGRA